MTYNEIDSDTIALLAIEMATNLKYGSNQSMHYLNEAKRLFEKRRKNIEKENLKKAKESLT